MYSEQLENLISAALADGVLTDKERQVLLKRAVAEGVDPDEFEMVLDARIVELQKQQAAALAPPPPAPLAAPAPAPAAAPAAAPAPKSQKHGEVRKCPNCGAVVEAATAKCESCGYAFVGIKANSSAEKLAQQLHELDVRYSENKKGLNIFAASDQEVYKNRERVSVIKNFPVPSIKEDLLEFAISMRSKWMNTESTSLPEKNAYKAKYHECIEKIKFFFPGDTAFNGILQTYEADKKKGSSISEKFQQNPLLLAGVCFLALFIMWILAMIFGK